MGTSISTKLKRIFKRGILILKRNGWLTVATVITMFLSILVFTGVLTMNYASNKFIDHLQDKIDISVYFKTGVDEGEILNIQEEIGKVEGVARTEYVSREKALTFFRERYGHNETILKALEEIGENPLSASINIKVSSPEYYETVLSYIETSIYKDKLERKNFTESRDLIERASGFITGLKIGSIAITLVLTTVAVIVAFNTIRIAIYAMREEIGIMKLVGASNWFIRGPFLLAGFFYGLIAALLSFVFYIPFLLNFGKKFDVFVGQASITGGFFSSFIGLLIVQLIFGAILGVISALWAIAKHLNRKLPSAGEC